MAAKQISPEMAQALKEMDERLRREGVKTHGGNRILKEKYLPTNSENSLVETLPEPKPKLS